MVTVMVISLGLYRSPPRYLYGSSGSVRRKRRRASNVSEDAYIRATSMGGAFLISR